jgi:hypothetical protein
MTDTEIQAAEELSQSTTIPVEAYVSADYARAERDKLWRKVWQQAGRRLIDTLDGARTPGPDSEEEVNRG